MITDQDITKLKKVFATKEELADLRVEVGELRETMKDGFEGLNVKFDRFLGKLDSVEQDNAAGAAILYRHTRQILALADGTGITIPEE